MGETETGQVLFELDVELEKTYGILLSHHIVQIFVHTYLCVLAHPARLLGSEIDRRRLDPTHSDPYFGVFHGVLRMPSDDMYGGLPYRDARGTVIFDNTSKLACGFHLNSTNVSAHGGVVGPVFEVLHFPGSERCTGPPRGYAAYNYRDKMEVSGWGSMADKDVSTLTTEEKKEICDRVQQENRGFADQG
jgi:hypothetical protein